LTQAVHGHEISLVDTHRCGKNFGFPMPLRLSAHAGRQPPRPCLRRRDSLVIAGRTFTLSWPAEAAGDPVGRSPDLASSALTVPCGSLCGWEPSGSWRRTFPKVVRPQGRHTATFAWPSRDLRRTQLRSSARSSAGQSSCLLSSGSRVRILPGALFEKPVQGQCSQVGSKR
jgi:hypothetical protein